ncbi:MAG: ACT domain-containing protein [Sedimentisphaerales bacterium]|nr:ACT domain-containing protein [Sedimentisphaerales bacterium]
MRLDTQFSIFMVNKPGVLAQVLGELAKEKINIVALTMVDTVEHGVLRITTAATTRTIAVLNKLNMQYSETDVLCLNLSNKAGAMADVTAKLAKAHINISYAYCTAGARGGRTTGILKVADVEKAMKVLAKPVAKSKKSASRRSPASKLK